MQKILVVEDDFDIRELLQNFLQEAGYEVATANDGIEALSLFSGQRYDLIILDILLPKIDGYGVCELIRKQSDVPIIMLTALSGEEDQIRGLDLQVDDYITKPFSMPILLRKIAAVLRRSKRGEDEKPQIITYGNLLLNCDSYAATVDGSDFELTQKEFEILRELLTHQGRILTRQNLLDKDGVYFMSTKKLLTLALGSALLVGVVAGCSSSVNIPSDNNTTKNVSYQAQTVSDTENAANDSTTAELPGGSVDYSIYEPYGLSYDQENYYFTYNGNVVRFFNDPIAGASFTNFFSGTVDIEADRDEENNLVGIKECSKENYDRHTQKHNNFNPTDTSLSTVQKGESTPQLWLKDYADYGITYNEQSGGWYYNNQRIKILLDSEQAVVYTDEENGVCVTISRDGNHQISEIKEISETDAQSLMLKNNPIGEDYTSQE